MTGNSEHQRHEARRLSALLNACPYPVWQRDAKLRITFCNQAFTELAEPDNDELLDFSDLELFRGHRDMALEAQQSGTARAEEKFVIAAGKRRLFRISEIPASDGTLSGFAVDISETDAARNETQRHITAQRDFLESTTSAMAVFGSDQRLILYNAAYSRLWRLEEPFLDSRPAYGEILEVLREQRRLPEQANFPAYKQSQLKWFHDLIETHEEIFYLPDGKTLRVLVIPHALGGLLIAYEDVTDRLALERSYNTLIAVQQETLDNIHEAVIVIGEDGRVRLCNPAFLKIWEIQEPSLTHEPHIRDALELFREKLFYDDWSDYKSRFIAKLQDRQNDRGKVELKNGSVLVWHKIALPDGGTLLAYNDITDSERLERSLRERNQALEAADKLKSEFLTNVSYELRSPLTSISGFADLLLEHYFGPLNESQQEYVQGIRYSSHQLKELIDNILDLASIEAGYLQLDLEPLRFEHLASEAYALVKRRMDPLNLKLSQQISSDIGEIRGDEKRLLQVLYNLLHNAIKYSPEGQEILLSARADSKWLEFSVTDHGVGIDPEHIDQIFERFYRTGASKGQQAGTGLGLAIVKHIVQLHGGSISVSSTPGLGTCFTCRLPKSPPAPPLP